MNVRRAMSKAATAVLLTLLGAAAWSPVAAADPLATVEFAVADVPLFEGPWTGAGSRDHGTWSFVSGRMVDGELRLHLEISPIRQPFAVKSGPAVLVAGLRLYGDAGGDVAIERRLPQVAAAGVAACADDSACHYSVDIAIPTTGLADAIDRLDGPLIWVSADLTLVRTFGAGQWLQVLPFDRGASGIAGVHAGRLGAMVPNHGDLQPAGLFPASQAQPIPSENTDFDRGLDYPGIVESIRSTTADDSSPVPMVDVAVHVAFQPQCPYEMELFLHDEVGNHVFHTWTDGKDQTIDGATTMPIATPWFLTLDPGDGVLNPVVRLGPIEAAGSQVEINATMDCVGRSGTLELVGAVTPTPTPTRPPLSSVGPLAPTIGATSSLTPGASGSPLDPAVAGTGPAAPVSLAVVVALLGLLALLAIRRRRVRS